MNRFRFVIYANEFELAVYFSEKEDKGLEKCKKYMSQFQRKVTNIRLRVDIFERNLPDKIDPWDRRLYKKEPFHFKRSLFKRPIEKNNGESK